MTTEGNGARLRLLYDLGCAITSRIELDELLPFVIGKCREALSAGGAAVLLLDRETNEFYFPYVAESDSETARRLSGHRFSASLGFAGLALRTGKSLKIDHVQNDPRHYTGTDKATGLATRNLIAVPLNSLQGPIGVIEVVNRLDGQAFSEDDVHFLEALSGSIAIALDNARLYAEARQAEARLRTQVGALRRDLVVQLHFGVMIGAGPAMAAVVRLMETAAGCSITVLVEGETGTGKELVARGIHRASARADGPFLAMNCAAMPEALMESELFGHRRGAFTGAIRDQPGLFRAASGGTVFLDEVGEMPPLMQAKLLRVLEQGEVVPLGENSPTKVDVRIVSATNRQLSAEVKEGKFRSDLFYRLAVFPIKLPPLRERREDIPALVQRFVKRAAERQDKTVTGFDESALRILVTYDWPGNIRELQNEVERAVAIARETTLLGVQHISSSIREAVNSSGKTQPSRLSDSRAPVGDSYGGVSIAISELVPPKYAETFREARAAFEARFIADSLTRCHGNVSRAARLMGLSRVQLQRKLKEYGLR